MKKDPCKLGNITFIAGPKHPNPGKPYKALNTTAFLPLNSDGKEVFCYERLLMQGSYLQLGSHRLPEKRIISFGTALNLRQVKVEVRPGTVLCKRN